MTTMTNQRWLLTTLGTAVLLAAAVAATFMVTDVYGLFRNPAGRQLPIFYADRNAKFLLGQRYIPANFNALLIGPSSSINWDPAVITDGLGVRMYNESLEGGNATEEKLLVDQALRRGHFRFALVVLYPTMINTHKYEDGLDKTRWTEALGSLDTAVETLLSTLAAHHIHFNTKNAKPNGSHDMPHSGHINPAIRLTYTVDPQGLHNLQTLAADLQAAGVRSIYVIPTLYEPMREGNAAYLANFKAIVLRALPPADLIDLNAPEYTQLRSDPANYVDGFHVTPAGADRTSRLLNQRLRTLLSSPAGK